MNLYSNLSLYAGTVEEDLEYTLNLVSTMKAPDPAKDVPGRLPELKAEIKSSLKDYHPEEAVRIAEFICMLENIYNSSGEIRKNLLDASKYPPINFDFSALPAVVSSIVKKVVDGFMSGTTFIQDVEDDIKKADKLINNALMSLCGVNGGRSVYYSAIAVIFKVMLGAALRA